jgi:hypothetical protein
MTTESTSGCEFVRPIRESAKSSKCANMTGVDTDYVVLGAVFELADGPG